MFSLTIDFPEMLVNGERLHNRMVRECLLEELQAHGIKRIPLHFRPLARHRYSYARRLSHVGRRSYDTWKRQKYGSTADLVKTGKSRAAMSNPANQRITIRGSAASGTLTGTLSVRFGWAGGTGKQRSDRRVTVGTTPKVMVEEVERIIPSEVREISEGIKGRYVAKVGEMLKRKQRIKLERRAARAAARAGAN